MWGLFPLRLRPFTIFALQKWTMKCSTNLISDITFFRCKTYRYMLLLTWAGNSHVCAWRKFRDVPTALHPNHILEVRCKISTPRFCSYIFLSSLCVPALQALMSENAFDSKEINSNLVALITLLFVKAFCSGQQYMLWIWQQKRITKLQIAYWFWNWENEPTNIFPNSAHIRTESELTAEILDSALSEFALSSAMDGAYPFWQLSVAVHFSIGLIVRRNL
jgi:hypothetical protein